MESITEEIFKVIKKHPLLLLALMSILVSGYGYMSQSLLTSHFEINIANYADLDDFFIASVKSIKEFMLIIFFAISFISLFILCYVVMKLLPSRNKIKLLPTHTKAILVLLSTMVLILYIQKKITYNQYLNITKYPHYKSNINLRTGKTLPENSEENLIFITGTDKYLFFYNLQKKDTLIIPTASITYISNQKI